MPILGLPTIDSNLSFKFLIVNVAIQLHALSVHGLIVPESVLVFHILLVAQLTSHACSLLTAILQLRQAHRLSQILR